MPTYDEAVAAVRTVLGPALKRSGVQKGRPRYNGPCPRCGGQDRFWVAQGAAALLLQCSHDCTYTQLLDALGLSNRDGSPARRAEVRVAATRNPWLDRVWRSTVAADGTLGARYLVDERHVWLSRGQLPAAVRWLPAQGAASLGVRRGDWPAKAAGCLVYRFAVPGEAETWALKVETITDDGAAVWFERGGKRPSLSGSVTGHGRRTFHASGDPIHGVHLVEGPIDALALVTLAALGLADLDGGAVLGADGIGAFTPSACLGRGPVTLYPDGARLDTKRGWVPEAAYKATLLAETLEETGRRVRIVRQSRGRDLADIVRDELIERLATRNEE